MVAAKVFTAAMAMFSDVQREAQEELIVVGPTRLPRLGGLESLSYAPAAAGEAQAARRLCGGGQQFRLLHDEHKGYHIHKRRRCGSGAWQPELSHFTQSDIWVKR